MVFSSVIFVFFFLPIFLLVYFVSPKKTKNLTILIFSFTFYYYGENYLIWILIASSLIDYLCGLAIEYFDSIYYKKHAKKARKIALIVSITSNMTFLFYFKYSNFIVDNISLLSDNISTLFKNFPEIALPLGISFYTFQSMSYTIDVYRRRVNATSNLIDFLAFVSMFPQLVAGPIVRYKTVAHQLCSRKESIAQFNAGFRRFCIGLAKKIVIANTVAVVADNIFALPKDGLSASLAWVGATAYSIQIYYDFSGYSDMAIGLGRMIGFKYPENFDHPYISKSIREFWRRWHITLSSWLRDYLYIPLGGSHCGTGRTYINLLTVFVFCGIWHGAEWTFLVWGLYHGFFIVFERIFKFTERIHVIFQHIYCILVVIFGWVIFRSETLCKATDYLRAMLDFSNFYSINYPIERYVEPDGIAAIILGVIFSAPIYRYFKKKIQIQMGFQYSHVLFYTECTWSTAMFILISAFMATDTYNPFLYFRF